MHAPPFARPASAGARRFCIRRGSTLLLLSVLLFALSLLLATALPPLARRVMSARVHETALALAKFETLYRAYAREHGDWPAGTDRPGAMPEGMVGALRDTTWEQRTPIGGRYVWLTNTVARGERFRAAIAIVSTPQDPVSRQKRALAQLVGEFDSGNRTRMRLGFEDQPLFILEH